jgi:hypothetical protein
MTVCQMHVLYIYSVPCTNDLVVPTVYVIPACIVAKLYYDLRHTITYRVYDIIVYLNGIYNRHLN